MKKYSVKLYVLVDILNKNFKWVKRWRVSPFLSEDFRTLKEATHYMKFIVKRSKNYKVTLKKEVK